MYKDKERERTQQQMRNYNKKLEAVSGTAQLRKLHLTPKIGNTATRILGGVRCCGKQERSARQRPLGIPGHTYNREIALPSI